MRINVPVEVESPTVNITLPPNLPLMCDADAAAELFGISARTLSSLRKHHKDFPVRNIGSSVRYLVPDLYAWFRDYPGREIPLE